MAASTDGDIVPGPVRRPERVRFHATLRQAFPMMAPLMCASLPLIMAVVTNPAWAQRPGAVFFVWDSIAYCATFLALAWFFARWLGVALTGEAVLVYGLGRRAIPWSDICAIRTERQLGTVRIVLCEWSGRRTGLRYPVSGPLARDRQFEQKLLVLRDWWLASRGDGMSFDGEAALAEVDARVAGFSGQPDRLRLLPSAVQQAGIVLVLIWVAGYAGLGALHLRLFPGAASAPTRLVDGAIALAAIAGIWHWSARAGITLTSGSLVVQRLRRTEIAWSQVRSVEVVRRSGGRRLVVRDASGQSTILPAPRIGTVLWDRDFDRRAMAVYRWWQQHRGPEPTPSNAPDPTGAGRPAVWQMAVLGIVVVAVASQFAILPVLAVLSVLLPGSGH